MNTDEGPRMNMQNHGMRKPMSGKYPEKSPNYSPSTSYNYSPQTGYAGNSQMYQRRRPEHVKRDGPSPYDRLARQNDIIIRLLKEIRDRLPEPQNPSLNGSDAAEPIASATAPAEGWERDENAPAECAEKTDAPMNEETGNDELPNPGNEAPPEE
jgi:hypothetical protein